jgi:transcriptional regulator with XRE-family HTH domain
MTQVQLAQASGVPQGLITCYETDSKMPSALKLAALAKALHVPMEQLVETNSQTPQVLLMPEAKLHGNSRGAKIQEIFLQLDEETQRLVLKQIKALAMINGNKTASTPKPT